ncbi:MAG: MFS transporter [Fibrobacterota bacterium]
MSAFKIRGLRWWVAGLLMCVTIINYLDRSCLSVAAPTLKASLSIDEQTFSYIIIAFQITYLICHPIAGKVIDLLGLRIGFTLSITFWSLVQMASGLASGWRSFALLRGLLGVGEAGNFPGSIKAVSEWFPRKERTLATGLFNTGASVGAMVAPPLVAFIILKWSWQWAFVLTGAFGLVWAFFFYFFYRSPKEHPLLTETEFAHIRQDHTKTGEGAAKPSLKKVLKHRNFWGISVARFFSEPAWSFFVYWIPLYLSTARGMNLKQIAVFAWLPFLASDFGSLFGGALSPLFMKLRLSFLHARKAAALTAALIMLFAVFIGKAPTPGWAVFFFCVGAFAHSAMSATLLTLPADLFPKETVGVAYGFTGSAALLGGMIFTFTTGYVVKHIGYAPLFPVIACLDLIGVAFLWSLVRQPISDGRLRDDCSAG